MRRKWIIGVVILVGLTLLWLLGPVPPKPDLGLPLPEMPAALTELEEEVFLSEAQFNIKPDNQARIIWYDSVPTRTEYSLVYLHGFSASQEEGDPIHEEFAKRYGMNVYLARIAGHGRQDAEPFASLTAGDMVRSASKALAIGKVIGEKVILMSTSTGGTLSLYLASGYEDIAGLILYSPNIDVYDRKSDILLKPWGLQLARFVTGSAYRTWEPPVPARQYWYARYRLEGVAALKALVKATMTREVFRRVHQPLLMLYYYKNEEERDEVVSLDRMLEMFERVSTPDGQKLKAAIPGAGHHVLASRFFSKDLGAVRTQTWLFAEEVLGLQQK